jgi:hypothetical protein
MDVGCTVRDGTGTIEREKAAWVLVEREVRRDRDPGISKV